MGREMMFAVDIDAEPAAVFEALATEAGLESFWTSNCDAVPEVGSVARFGFGKAPMDLRMRIDALEPDREVVWTCVGDFPYWADTTIRWRLEPNPEGPGTRLVLSHTGWPADQPEYEYATVSFTWARIVERLREVLASGRPDPYLG